MGIAVEHTHHRGGVGEHRGADRLACLRRSTPTSTPRSPPPARAFDDPHGLAHLDPVDRARRHGAPRRLRSMHAPRRWRTGSARRTACRSRIAQRARGRVPAGRAALLRGADPGRPLEEVRDGSASAARSRCSRMPLGVVGGDRAVELPAVAGVVQARARPGGGLHAGAQAEPGDGARRPVARRGGARGRDSRRRDQHRAGRPRDRRLPGRAPAASTRSRSPVRPRRAASIAEACGRLLRPVTLELGGKSAAIVLDDADLELRTWTSLFAATLLNNGQTCFLSTRDPRAGARATTRSSTLSPDLVRACRVGDALDPSARRSGRWQSQRQRDRVRELHRQGQRRRCAARPPAAGGPRAWTAAGSCEPTVFADVDNASIIAQEEIFGPVLSVIPYGMTTTPCGSPTTPTSASAAPCGRRTPSAARPSRRRVQTGTIGVNVYHAGSGRTVRWHQGLRPRPRTRPGRPERLPDDQVDLPALVARADADSHVSIGISASLRLFARCQ